MSKRHILEYDINNVRKGDSKMRIWKDGFGMYMIAIVVYDVEGETYAIDSKDMPTIIRTCADGDTETILKELAELPVTLTLVEN